MLNNKQTLLSLFPLSIALLVGLPIFVIVSYLFVGSGELWQHLFESVLGDYVLNSLLLMVGVSIGVLALGLPSAWLISFCEFPGRRLLSWALLLPLAFPAYIIAYTYTGMLDAFGVVQTLLREITGLGYGEYWFFDIRSLGGAILMMSLVLYPYVYLLARSAFMGQSATLIEAGRTLGSGRFRLILSLSLPIARPAIIAGLTLALMETLADYGTVQYFGVSTFTTGIFRAFYGFGDTPAAAQLAAVLLSFVIFLIVIERYSRRQARYYDTKSKAPYRIQLSNKYAALALFICAVPLVFGFIIPAIQLLYWALFESEIDTGFLSIIWNSLSLSLLAAGVTLLLALLLAYSKRLYKRNKVIGVAIPFACLGYAIPGTIIAIGIIIPLAWFDTKLIQMFKYGFDMDVGLILSGTLFALIFAYMVRFLAVSFGAIDSGLQQIKPNIDDAARLMGYRPLGVLKNIHLPLLKTSLLTAFLIVFVDTLKELPATLILRPFNFNTLAVRAYELASDERLVDAAPASLLIVLVGLIPVILLSRSINMSKELK